MTLVIEKVEMLPMELDDNISVKLEKQIMGLSQLQHTYMMGLEVYL